MGKTNSPQKKKIAYNYLYATLIGLLVVACAVTIALASSAGTKVNSNANIGGNEIPVAAVTYVVPMRNATILKDYSASELQYNDTLKQWEIHKAIDFKPSDDLQVYAVSKGTVSKVYNNYLEGTVVEINHSNGLISIYKSLAKDVNVKVGDNVTAGQVIGEVADTMAQELAAGAHLHFEMELNATKVNPNDYIDLGNK